jgi:hypothetical protein
LDLQAASGASLPIMDGDRVGGTLFLLSLRERFTSAHTGAMSVLCEAAERSYASLRARMRSGAHRARHPWRQMPFDAFDVYTFAPEDGEGSATAQLSCERYIITVVVESARSEDPARVSRDLVNKAGELLRDNAPPRALEYIREVCTRAEIRAITAILDSDGILDFLTAGCPPPLHVGSRGPAALLEAEPAYRRGSMHLRTGSLALLYGTGFSRRVESGEMIKAVQDGMRSGARNPLACVPDLLDGRGAPAFAGIMKRSAAVALRRPLE